VLYLGHIPHGFFEVPAHITSLNEQDEMLSFFAQFDETPRVRLSRNKKVWYRIQALLTERRLVRVSTMPSFNSQKRKRPPSPPVYDRQSRQLTCVSEALDGYLLFGRKLVAQVVDNPHDALFKGANVQYKPIDGRKRHRDSADGCPRACGGTLFCVP